MQPVVAPSARKHGVADEDMLHAFDNPVFVTDLDDGFVMIVGADTAGRLIKVGFVARRDGMALIHAMRPARRKFVR